MLDKSAEVQAGQARLLQSQLRVLAYGANSLDGPEEKSLLQQGAPAQPAKTAVLAVPVERVRELMLASRAGRLQLALRRWATRACPISPPVSAAPRGDAGARRSDARTTRAAGQRPQPCLWRRHPAANGRLHAAAAPGRARVGGGGRSVEIVRRQIRARALLNGCRRCPRTGPRDCNHNLTEHDEEISVVHGAGAARIARMGISLHRGRAEPALPDRGGALFREARVAPRGCCSAAHCLGDLRAGRRGDADRRSGRDGAERRAGAGAVAPAGDIAVAVKGQQTLMLGGAPSRIAIGDPEVADVKVLPASASAPRRCWSMARRPAPPSCRYGAAPMPRRRSGTCVCQARSRACWPGAA